ncbi:MAG: DUF1583 domain-containing protein, partial [Planctomycetota bacterium]
VESNKEVFEQVRDTVMLCAAESLHDNELAKLSAEILPSLTERYRTEYGRTAWHRHFYAIEADAQLAASGRDAYQANEDMHPQWHTVSVSTARERGSAYPESRWVIEEGSARKLASHHDDFLFFRSPMLGDFDVETHATGFGYRESHVLVGGLWTGLVSNHRQYVFGNVRGELSRVDLDRQLSDTHRHGFIHTRIRSRDSTASTYLNGHPAFEYLKPANADPWLAIRSMYRVSGGVDDFRISGNPVVPETIEMIDSNQLLSWYDYFWVPHLDSNRLGPWTARGFHHLEHEIVSSQSDLLPAGSHAEELLVYTRPMIEDGSIEYEFWYEPNAFDAAPCVAGLAYRLTPRGVLEHRVTHGRYDRSPLRPDNVMPGRLSKQLSKPELDPGHWNRVTLSLVGSTLTISLNDQDVFQTDVDVPANERHFGLFHFADQSSLRVRNARWTGDWPKDTPSLDEQSLVSFEYANVFLNQSALPDRLTHSFDRTSLIDGQFAVVEGDPINDVDATDDGLQVTRIGRSGYQAAMIGRSMQVSGDFDVTIGFDQLQRETAKGKIASVRLIIQASNDRQDSALIQLIDDREGERMVQCMIRQIIEGKERRHYFGSQPMEADAARLRLSRRDGQVYYLVAEHDSDQFRIIGKQDFSNADLKDASVQFGVQVQDAGSRASTRLKSFDVRADKITVEEIEDPSVLIDQLNQSRAKLAIQFQHDFAANPPLETQFYWWTDVFNWKASDGGLIVRAPGAIDWTSGGLSMNEGYRGDFDIKFRFQRRSMVTPQDGKNTQVYLQIDLGNQDRTQLSVMLTKRPDERFATQAQIRNRLFTRYKYTNVGTSTFADPDFLRLARRSGRLHWLAGNEAEQTEFLIASQDVGEAPILNRGVRMMLHTGHVDGVSKMLARSIEVRAETKVGLNLVPAMRPTSPQPTLPDRIFQSLRDLF